MSYYNNQERIELWPGWTYVRIYRISDEIDTWIWKNIDSDNWAVADDPNSGLYLVFRHSADAILFKLRFRA